MFQIHIEGKTYFCVYIYIYHYCFIANHQQKLYVKVRPKDSLSWF